MTLREALVTAVDFIRGSGTEEPELLVAAKKLERKAERMRALTEMPAFWPHWCECGDRKAEGRLYCNACTLLFPEKLWQQFHRGSGEQSLAARAKMNRLSRNRLNTLSRRKAA